MDAWDGISLTMDVELPEDEDSDITLEIDTDTSSSLAVTYTSEVTEDEQDSAQSIGELCPELQTLKGQIARFRF